MWLFLMAHHFRSDRELSLGRQMSRLGNKCFMRDSEAYIQGIRFNK